MPGSSAPVNQSKKGTDMQRAIVAWLLFGVCCLTAPALPLGDPLPPPRSQAAGEELPPDSLAFPADTTEPCIDSAAATAEEQENDFQQALDTLFSYERSPLDTFAWDTSVINSGRFASASWADTARIQLVDTTQGRRFVFPAVNAVTSDFGQRGWLWHYGIDIRLKKGDTVATALDGVVRVIQYDRRGYGHVVVVRHWYGLETIYGHLSRVTVAVNQKLRAGEAVGLGGSTGRSTGCHLHFEMRYYGEPFDPKCIIDFENCRLKCDTLQLTRTNFEYLVELRKTRWHTIRKGETLGHIARAYRTSVSRLCAYNHITPRTLLRIGRKIIVAKDARPAMASPIQPRLAGPAVVRTASPEHADSLRRD
jgi:murein DD-endopeptidase MepM/ murein hydrolase activator NlpD